MLSNNPVLHGDVNGCSPKNFEEDPEFKTLLSDPSTRKALAILTSAMEFNADNTYSLRTQELPSNQKKLTVNWDVLIPTFAPSEDRRNSEFALEGNYAEAFKKDLPRLEYRIETATESILLTGNGESSEDIFNGKLQIFEQHVNDSTLRTAISRRAHQGVLADMQFALQTMLNDGLFLTDSDTRFDIKLTDDPHRSIIAATVAFNMTNPDTELQVPGATVSMTRSLTVPPSASVQPMDAVQYSVSIVYETPPDGPGKTLARRLGSYFYKSTMGGVR
jgi:hypothetical protein